MYSTSVYPSRCASNFARCFMLPSTDSATIQVLYLHVVHSFSPAAARPAANCPELLTHAWIRSQKKTLSSSSSVAMLSNRSLIASMCFTVKLPPSSGVIFLMSPAYLNLSPQISYLCPAM